MKKINSKIIFVIVLALIFILALTACDENIPSPSPTNTGEQITVVDAVEKFLDALDNSGTLIGNNVINLDLRAEYVDGDDTYEIVFQANIDPSGIASSNSSNKVYLDFRKDSVSFAGIYYMDGVLYLQIPLEGSPSQKIYINDLTLSDVISYIGPIDDIQFSSFKNTFALVVESVDYSSEGDIETITYHLDMEKLFETLFDLLSGDLVGIDPDLIFTMFDTSSDPFFYEMGDLDEATVTVEIEEGYFSKFAYDSGEG